jgi:poly-gamma-glutamate synthase PgsB/CapB
VASESADVPTRRWAAAAAERVWVQLDSVAGPLYARLAARIQFLRRGQMCQIPASWVRDVDGNTLGRILAVMTQDDFGIEVTRGAFGYTVRRQPQFGFRCWRAWHEFWRPATDKRQAHSHTIGRISQGTIRAPSRIMGELSATKVPGEPLVIAADGTWRPFLPLVDDFVSALNQSVILPRTTRLYSSEGVTEIEVSRNPFRRLAAALRLIVRFNDYAELRNWTPSLQQRPDKYLQTMQRAGFRVRFRPHGDRPSDSTVTQFFPALLALGAANWWPVANDVVQQYALYFGSAFQNTLTQLVAFTAIALVLFLARHGLSNFRIRRARRQIPLAIGGWGTRGKSGTERLKAALVNATGHGLVSKTTGCEAMFIHAPPCGEPLEIPLYRPGDKATIWEQSNLLRIAATMRPSAFLWECMALTPDYVHLLQHQWMHDDLATITNTYPDHEDIQGPAGIDVASTITVFVPRRARLLSTEQQMFPLLRERCARLATSVRCVTWLESGLITDDLLDRFPYREHPDNIALVAAVAEELGCSRDFALKAMADHLVPDLGVLKTHPRSRVEDCSLEFTNGMSANERFGCLGNWKRLGFDHHDPRQEPTTFLSTVVNNRADRVARSGVFASVLVNDLQADRHFLIGGNLEGLQGFIWEAWDAYERSVALRREGGQWDGAYALELLQRLAKRFRIPTTDQQLQSSLQAMLTAVAADNDERMIGLADQLLLAPEQCTTRLMALGVTESATARVTRHWEQLMEGRRELIELNKFISAARTADHFAQAEARLRQTIKHWFARKLIVIENYDATGEEIIRQIVDHTPPGFLNRVMGIQNIKGTGLDFVYRFHAWDTCHQACQMLKSSDPAKRATALTMLQTLPEYGLLCQSLLQSTCEQLRHASPPLPPAAQVQLEAICRKLDENIQASRERQERPVRGERNDGPAALSSHPWLSWVLNTLEQWREVNDAVRRRHQADQIYRDLQHQRIGRQRAVQELRHLNRRQKGGWLAGRLLNRRP